MDFWLPQPAVCYSDATQDALYSKLGDGWRRLWSKGGCAVQPSDMGALSKSKYQNWPIEDLPPLHSNLGQLLINPHCNCFAWLGPLNKGPCLELVSIQNHLWDAPRHSIITIIIIITMMTTTGTGWLFLPGNIFLWVSLQRGKYQ